MSDVVKKYYNNNVEREYERLNNHYSIIEFRSTLYLMEKYFLNAKKIIDIGSGPGKYSIELLKRGYDVTLFELSENALKFAKSRIDELGFVAKGYINDTATNLNNLNEDEYDGMLVLGPMYHLHNQKDRLSVLEGVKKTLKPGGTAIISYVNSLGILRAAVTEFPDEFTTPSVENYINGDWKLSAEESFTDVFFTTPNQALKEVEDSGLEVISYAGAESFLSGLHIPLKRLKDSNQFAYSNLLDAAVNNCELDHYRDTTEHLLIVVRKK